MSLRPRRISDKAHSAFSAAKAKLKSRRKKASELRASVLESKLAGALTKAKKNAQSAGGGLSRSSSAVLKMLNTRGHDGGQAGPPFIDGGGISPDVPPPKNVAGKASEAQRTVVHLAKKEETKSKAKTWTKFDERAKKAWLAAFQSPERREWGLSNEELRFRRKLVEMWWEFQQKLKSIKGLSSADVLLYEVVLALMIEFYGEELTE